MKKCSTAALCLSVLLAVMAGPAAAREGCHFLDAAPDAHRVRQGDTLWDIATTFLKQPWCWPQVWALNREQISNPHLIYPGQLIVFDRQQQRLRVAPADGTAGTCPARHSPAIRVAPAERTPIPAIDPDWQSIASQLRLVPAGAGDRLPRIIGFSDGRRLAASGDIALVDIAADTAAGRERRHAVVRQLPVIVDPDNGEVLALPLLTIGQADHWQTDGPQRQRVRITGAQRELTAGDLLAPVGMTPDASRSPLHLHPAPPVDGRVAAVLSGGQRAAQRDLVALNRGRKSGLATGSLVAVMRHVRIAADDAPVREPLPAEPVATLVVLEALDQVSLALVLRSEQAFMAGDTVRSVAPDPR